MTDLKCSVKYAIAFGVCVTIATASSAQGLPPMDESALENFQVDCTQKQVQTDMLISMRTRAGERSMARLENFFTPWRQFTDPSQHNYMRDIGRGKLDWLIDNHLNHLRDCP